MKSGIYPTTIKTIFYSYLFIFILSIPSISYSANSDIHTLTGKVGKYLGFSLSRDEGIACGSKAPDWRRVTGNFPAGMA